MVHLDSGTIWIFIVDTDKYAGNFERQMCAFMTGQLGECEVGEGERLEYLNFMDDLGIGPKEAEAKFEYVKQLPDDHGCCRPCSVWQSLEGGCHSVAIFFSQLPSSMSRQFLTVRAERYCEENKIKFLGVRMQVYTSTLADLALPADGCL